MTYTVGLKGQVVIAKDIRDRLGVGPGWIAIQRLIDGHVEISFVPPPHRDSLKGILAPYVQRHLPEGQWEEVRAAAWREAASQDEESGERREAGAA